MDDTPPKYRQLRLVPDGAPNHPPRRPDHNFTRLIPNPVESELAVKPRSLHPELNPGCCPIPPLTWSRTILGFSALPHTTTTIGTAPSLQREEARASYD